MCQFTCIQTNNVFLKSFMSDNLNSIFSEEIAKILMIISRVAAKMLSGDGWILWCTWEPLLSDIFPKLAADNHIPFWLDRDWLHPKIQNDSKLGFLVTISVVVTSILNFKWKHNFTFMQNSQVFEESMGESLKSSFSEHSLCLSWISCATGTSRHDCLS